MFFNSTSVFIYLNSSSSFSLIENFHIWHIWHKLSEIWRRNPTNFLVPKFKFLNENIILILIFIFFIHKLIYSIKILFLAYIIVSHILDFDKVWKVLRWVETMHFLKSKPNYLEKSAKSVSLLLVIASKIVNL